MMVNRTRGRSPSNGVSLRLGVLLPYLGLRPPDEQEHAVIDAHFVQTWKL